MHDAGLTRSNTLFLGTRQDISICGLVGASLRCKRARSEGRAVLGSRQRGIIAVAADGSLARLDRKSTRLNSSHTVISYAVFCLKKKTLPPEYSYPLPHRGPSFANALVENIAPGWTTVRNRAARALLRGR